MKLNDTNLTENNFDRLREITESLPKLSDLLEFKNGNNIEYHLLSGKCIGKGLMKEQGVAVQVCELDKDSEFPVHLHQAKEWLIAYKGSFTLKTEKSATLYGVGEMAFIDTNIAHSLIAEEDCSVIALTIPASGGFPNGSTK